MKVIFLDVDGVLNSSRSELAKCGNAKENLEWLLVLQDAYNFKAAWGIKRTLETIDPVAVGLLNLLVQKAEAKIVLSTSHRVLFSEFPTHRQLLGFYFKALGLEAPIFDLTPVLHQQRCVEVRTWQNEHSEVTHHVILDDVEKFGVDQNFVKCDPHVGFSYQNYIDCCAYLEVP